jgi:peptidoglycan L-alanyl-D-glutamate endopeptidase CwlK
MARVSWLSIVCILIYGSAAAQQVPLASEESEVRLERLTSFSQPVDFRFWEIVEDTADQWREWDMVDNYSFGINRGSLSMISDLESLHPYFRDKVLALIRECKAKGIHLAVVETYRTPAKQNEYKTMGRRYTRAKAGQSKHQYGLAVDVVPMIDSIPQWRNTRLWRKIGPIGERLGLRWGGRWRKLYDPAHFEWTGGLMAADLNKGKFPAIPRPQDYPCLEEDLKELRRHWKAWQVEQEVVAKRIQREKLLATSAAGKLVLRGGEQ